MMRTLTSKSNLPPEAEKRLEEAVKRSARGHRERVDLSHCNLTTFKVASIARFQKLDSLILDHNSLTELDPDIKNLTTLRSLKVSYNELTALPRQLGSTKLSNLHRIEATNNKITALPDKLCQCTPLKALVLAHNNLKEFPADFHQLTNLIELSVAFNEISVFPEAMTSLGELEFLSLANNQLGEAPTILGTFTKLKALNLRANNMFAFPEFVVKLPFLEVLNIQGNRVGRGLPASIGDFKVLLDLNLHYNELRWLPPEIGNLTSLKILNLGRNRLDSLPPTICNLTQLQTLDLASNILDNLPPNFIVMAEIPNLDLSDNQLSNLPEPLDRLIEHKNVNFDGNPLGLFMLRAGQAAAAPPAEPASLKSRAESTSKRMVRTRSVPKGQILTKTGAANPLTKGGADRKKSMQRKASSSRAANRRQSVQHK